MNLQFNNNDNNNNNLNESTININRTKNCFACLKNKTNENFVDRRGSMNDTPTNKKRIKRKQNGINISKFSRFINYIRYITKINKNRRNYQTE